jgi:hypothetical protein
MTPGAPLVRRLGSGLPVGGRVGVLQERASRLAPGRRPRLRRLAMALEDRACDPLRRHCSRHSPREDHR